MIRIVADPLKEKREMLLPAMLFDLETDPGETTNVAENNPEIAKDLLGALAKWEKGLAQPRWYDGGSWQYWADVQIKNHKL